MSDSSVIVRKNLTADLDTLYLHCRQKHYALAVWREPGKEIQAVIDPGETRVDSINLESSVPGFLFHPYDNQGNIHLIRSIASLTRKGQGFEWESDPKKLAESITPASGIGRTPMTFTIRENPEAEHIFVDVVENAKSAITNGLFHKVVPSRAKDISISGLNLDTILTRLAEKYPNAFVSITFIPGVGLWIGASPEILVKTQEDTFQTVALAGTQPYTPDKVLSEISWTQKEIEEQAYVSRYIINCFKKIRLREFTEIGPKSVVSGNLIHLKTRFMVDMKEVNFPQLGTVMMELLHPTSAVCGMPLEAAQRWLNEHENYQREYFSGFLGPVNVDSATSLYVNLRCMKVMNDKVRLYAGAGITEDSKPAKEWEETEMKMNTLLDVIF